MSGHRYDVLAIVDAATLLSEYPDASKDADTPSPIDGRYIHVLSPGDDGQVAHNDGQLFTGLSVGDDLHLRETALALRAEVSVLFVRFALNDPDIVSPVEPQIRDVDVPVPNFDDLFQPKSQPMKDHFWHSTVLAAGNTRCTADLAVLDRDGAVLGYFRWEASVVIVGN